MIYLEAKVPEMIGCCQPSCPSPHYQHTLSLLLLANEWKGAWQVLDEAHIDIASTCEELEHSRHLLGTPYPHHTTKTETLQTLLYCEISLW